MQPSQLRAQVCHAFRQARVQCGRQPRSRPVHSARFATRVSFALPLRCVCRRRGGKEKEEREREREKEREREREEGRGGVRGGVDRQNVLLIQIGRSWVRVYVCVLYALGGRVTGASVVATWSACGEEKGGACVCGRAQTRTAVGFCRGYRAVGGGPLTVQA